jgi:hypothetical protein
MMPRLIKQNFPSWKNVSDKPIYHFDIRELGGWRIGFGVGSCLIAEGSGFSRPIGMKLLEQLRNPRKIKKGNR